MRPARWWRLAATVALLATLVAPALPGAAGGRVLAHAQIVASSPGAGATVPESPDELRLIFSEPLEAQYTSLDIADLNGNPVLARAGEVDPNDPYALVAADPGLPDGVYLVTWRTLSAADGHVAEGFFNFGVGNVPGTLASGPHGVTHTAADPVSVIGRWLTYLGLLAALGLAVFHRLVIRDGPMPRALVRALAAGLFVTAAATLTAAIVAGVEAGSVLDYLFGGRNGGLQLARAGIAAIGGVALLLVAPRFTGAVAAATGLTGIGALVLAGHAAALPGIAPLVAQVVHVVGAAIWIGGIIGLLLLARRPGLVVGNGQPPQMRTVVPRFSALALVSIGLVVLTGVYSAWMQTGALVTGETEYGRTLLMKASFASGALALGALNYLDGGRMMGWLAGFRSRITIEVMLAATVLVLTAVLASTAPTEEPPGVAILPIPDAFGEVAPGMTMDVIPGRPGVNRVVVTTTDAMAGSVALELGLDRLDDGTTTRVPLALEGMSGMDHTGDMTGMATEDGTVDWTADALVLPAGSQWDTSVRILSPTDSAEISRQRFAFTVDQDGIDEGRATSLLNPATVIAVLLLVGGGLALGFGLGGASLPRTEVAASRMALLMGGSVAVVLGGLIGASRLLG